jgi:hypothetical protein
MLARTVVKPFSRFSRILRTTALERGNPLAGLSRSK